MKKSALLEKVLTHWEIRKPQGLYGLTFFLNDRLWVIRVDADPNGRGVLSRGSFPVAEVIDEAGLQSFRRDIHASFEGPVAWIHLVLRCSGLVKTFAVPESPQEAMESVLRDRVREEIPHLADEVIYHARLQEKADGKKSEGLMFGVPKNVLNEQLALLGRLQIFPERVMLSTEVLAWLYTQDPVGENGSSGGAAPRAFFLEDQGELLYMKGQALVQSQWVRHTDPDVLAAQAAPMPDSAFWSAAVRAYETQAAFDFSPPDLEGRRLQESRKSLKQKLLRSAAFLCFAFFILGAAQTLRLAAQTGWIELKAAPVRRSVSELKKMRQQALALMNFQAQKAMPVLLLDALRRPMPQGILLSDLEYNEPESCFFARGQAQQQADVDSYVLLLQQESLFRISLSRLEAVQSPSGATFQFELAGTLEKQEQA